MIRTSSFVSKPWLLTTSAALSLLAIPAFAQDQTPPAAPAASAAQAPADQAAGDQGGKDIVVTGSLFRQAVTPSPVTTLSVLSLEQRGISTVQEGIQRLSSNNGPSLTNSFSANGAFAGGASAVSLRGLSSSSTLVLIDGLRAAYYPLADDATRNFVDLNTIPDDVVDRIEVLKDGASSSYGADAIAGVVNIITKRSIQGVSGRAEAGISQDGTAPSQRLTLTAGKGNLDTDGYNAYISGFYYRSGGVSNSDLRAPFNSSDQTSIGGPNNIVSPSNFGVTNAGSNFYVRPTGGTQFALLGNNCVNGSPVANTVGGVVPSTVCSQDNVNRTGVVAPTIERFGGSAKFTAKLGDSSEGYAEFNFLQTRSSYDGDPSVIYGNGPAGILFQPYSTRSSSASYAPGSAALTLPVYVCAGGVNCAIAADRRLNPNNPYAAAGQTAQIVGTLPNSVTRDETRYRVFRAAAGIHGTVFGDWDYRLDLTAMHTDLRHTQDGYVYIQHLLDEVADGSYNFANPAANTAAVQSYLTPQNITDSSSDLYQAQASVSKALFQLPGGPLQLGAGASIYYEGVDSPSANSDINGPTQRYFTINAFGTNGHRTVTSAFGELNAPVFDQLLLNASGRYDHYSTGQGAFSPKFGAKFTPIKQVTIRGTWSRGFRIPSFAEANALPTTGYVTNSASLFNDAYLKQYNCTVATFSTACPTYLRSGSYGATTLASPNLKPERSRSITGGIVFEPIRNVTLTVDYFNIKKTNAITSLTSGDALNAYYSGAPTPAGFALTPDAPDAAFPNATPRVLYVASALVNANTIKSEGIDFGLNSRVNVRGVTWTSNLDATLQLELSTTFPDGHKETYVDTLGNFNLTAGSGTYRWRGNWQNTFQAGAYALTGTVNYTSGYDLSAEDQGNAYRDCGLAPSPAYTGCRVKSYITFDLNTSVRVSDGLTFYVNAINLFDRLPPIDPVTYGGYLYNPVQSGEGIYGRRFLAGARFKL